MIREMGTTRKPALKAEALRLRGLGYSYNMIIDELELSKSTLSGWLRHIPFEPSRKMASRISAGRAKSAETKKSLKQSNIDKALQLAKREVGKLTSRDLFMLGIAIYYGEGSKSNEDVRIVNSDPTLIRFAVAWFKKCCFLEVNNFAPRIHLYPDCNERESKNYWAVITGIPIKQFQKQKFKK